MSEEVITSVTVVFNVPYKEELAEIYIEDFLKVAFKRVTECDDLQDYYIVEAVQHGKV